MVVLIDTNVILDSVLDRKPFVEQSNAIFELCFKKKLYGCIAAHSITNLFFILRKHMTGKQRRVTLLKLCRLFTVVSIDSDKIISALNNDNFSDFEDCLQDECAVDFDADYIITRNISDFKGSKVKAVEPSEFWQCLPNNNINKQKRKELANGFI